MEIHFATWLIEMEQGNALTKKGGKHRLLSYLFVVDNGTTKKQLKEYVNSGKLDLRKIKK